MRLGLAAADVLGLPSTFVAWASARTSSMLALQGTRARSARSSKARLVSVLLPGPSATT